MQEESDLGYCRQEFWVGSVEDLGLGGGNVVATTFQVASLEVNNLTDWKMLATLSGFTDKILSQPFGIGLSF